MRGNEVGTRESSVDEAAAAAATGAKRVWGIGKDVRFVCFLRIFLAASAFAYWNYCS
jgi:hypothetical protein